MSGNVKLSSRDIEVLIALINPQNMKFPRTQKEAGEYLRCPAYAVSRSTKRLIEGKYIRKKKHEKSTVYIPGTNYNIAISQITDEFKAAFEKKVQLTADRVAVTYPVSAEALLEPFTLQPHLSGAMPMFNVVTEGKLQFVQSKERYDDRMNMIHHDQISILDMRKREKVLNGSENWDGIFTLDHGRSYRIRYQKTKNYRRFYVGPQYDIEAIPSDILTKTDAPYDRVILECYPMLSWLYRYAGWRFVTDKDDNFIPFNKMDPGDTHVQVNHQPTTDFLKAHVGPFKADGLCADESGGTLRYEVKANRQDYITALVDGPVTRELAFKHEENLDDINRKMESMDRSLSDIKQSFGKEVVEVWLALEEIAQSQHATIKASSVQFDAAPIDDGVMFG